LTAAPGPDRLAALLARADAAADAVERHLWLVQLLAWVRADGPPVDESDPARAIPWPVRRLQHLLAALQHDPAARTRVSGLLRATLAPLDAAGLLADFGFAPRQGFVSEFAERLRLMLLPGTPQTGDLGELFQLVFADGDQAWIEALDDATARGLLALCTDTPQQVPEALLIEAIQLLSSQMRAAGLAGAMRQRIDRSALAQRPFHELSRVAEALHAHRRDGGDAADRLQQVQYLRALLQACHAAAASVREHLDEHGISVDLVFQVDQLMGRGERIEDLLALLVAPDPAPEWRRLWARLAEAAAERRGLRRLFARHYALLARKVTERSAETGEHYITRDRAGWLQMLRHAAGGGAVIGGTTLAKFALGALALPVFWAGLAAGLNYALSFVLVQLLHWTVATKQPAMTAPSLAARLEGTGRDDAAVEGFVDEVAHLLRSQMAGIVGNLALVVPVVLAAQGLAWWWRGAPLVGEHDAHYVLHSLDVLGPSALFAAFTGVLLFASSLIAGWVENWFVFHRLDSAIAWNPRSRALLGPERAQRWSRWWRQNISGLAANTSLGLMLGLVPALGSFFGLPLEVRHVTLAMGQLAAALGALGPELLRDPAFWRCLAAIPLIGALNLGVSFTLAFRVALASRALRVRERGRIHQAIRSRFTRAPLSFFWPPANGPRA
jgi:site-specific recombinase